MQRVRAWLGPDGYVVGVKKELDVLAQVSPSKLSSHELAESLKHVDDARREAMSPAGGPLGPGSGTVGAAVAVGLVVGKPIGVLVTTWLVLRLRIGALPAG